MKFKLLILSVACLFFSTGMSIGQTITKVAQGAKLSGVEGFCLDNSGNIFAAVTDYGSEDNTGYVYKITPSGVMTLVAGKETGYFQEKLNGPATESSIDRPKDVALDASGNMYIAGYGGKIYKVDAATKIITQFAAVSMPLNLEVYGNYLYVIAGNYNSSLLKYNLSSPGIAPVTLKQQLGLALGIDKQENVYVCGQSSGTVYKIAPNGTQTTINTGFNYIQDLKIGSSGEMYLIKQADFIYKYISPGLFDTYSMPSTTQGYYITLDADGSVYKTDGYSSIYKMTFGPPAPTNIVVTAGNGTVGLSWNAVSVATAYKVYKGTSASTLNYLASVSSGTSYTDNDVANGTTYYYSITTIDNTNKESSQSSAISAKPLATPQITAPQDISVNIDQSTYVLTAPASNSQGSFSYTSSNPAIATISGSTVTLKAEGETTLTATQAAAGAYSTGSVTFKLTVTNLPQPAFGSFSIASATYGDGPVTIAAPASNSSGAFSYISSNPSVASINGNIITILKAGTVTITAKQAATTSHSAGSTAASLIIKQHPLTAGYAPVSRVYDGSNTASVSFNPFTPADGLIGNDNVTVVYTSATYSDKNAGDSKVITFNGLALAGTNKDNYTLIPLTVTGSITAKFVTATALPVSKIYDGNQTANITFNTLGSANGKVGSDDVSVVYTSATYADKNVGTGIPISFSGLSLTGSAKDNYSLSPLLLNGSIIQKPVTVSAVPNQKIYGESDPALTYTPAQALIQGDTFTGMLKRLPGETAGTYTIEKGTLILNENYALTYVPASFTISKAQLTVTADDKNKIMGLSNPALTASYSGLAMGDESSVISNNIQLSTSVSTSTGLGFYPISVSGPLETANYKVKYVNGTLEVKPGAPKDIQLAIVSKIYENQQPGITSGTLSSTSDDPNAIFTYSLVSGADDNKFFTISGNELKTAASFDYEAKNSYMVTIRSTTQYGFSLDKQFSVSVSDINEVPELNEVENQQICALSGEHAVRLTGISAGPESAQRVVLSANSSIGDAFRKLKINYSSGSEGVLSYELKDGFTGTVTITVVIKDDGGTENGGTDTFSRTFQIAVNPLPETAITSNIGTSISKGLTAILTATGGTKYVWADVNGIISGQNSSALTVRPDKTTTYKVTAFNANGCSKEQEITINVLEDYQTLNATNILTPNGDGANDSFVIRNIDMYPGNTVRIYDRGGKLLYNTMNYNNDWKGTVNGSPLPTGTYYYIVDFGKGKQTIKGFITLVNDNN